MQQEAADAFNIDLEPKYIRDMYGPGTQARQILIARRLVERGVRFVQLWHGEGQPWDNHDDIEVNHRRLAKDCDQAIAALIRDLKQRGLFEQTLVMVSGEFGRTPTVELPTPGSNAGKVNGRDHNHYGFTMLLAGGGVRGGYVHGATDEFGFQAVEKKVHVHDLHATILHLLGFDHEKFTYRYAGRDFRLTDVHGHVVARSSRIGQKRDRRTESFDSLPVTLFLVWRPALPVLQCLEHGVALCLATSPHRFALLQANLVVPLAFTVIVATEVRHGRNPDDAIQWNKLVVNVGKTGHECTRNGVE